MNNAAKKVYELEILSKAEKHKLLYEFNDTKADYPKDKCVHQLFEEQAVKMPNKTAVVACDKTLTYDELNRLSNRIANALIERGIKTGDIVAFALPRRSYLIVVMFGILKSDAAYMPIDPDYPKDRIDFMLNDSRAKLFITDDNLPDYISDNEQNPDIDMLSNNFCYCIYTSGSTGEPKTVAIYHKNLIHYLYNLREIYRLSIINMPFYTNQSVDLTVTSLYFPLSYGGTIYVYDNDLNISLKSIIDNENLTVMKMTPTHMQIMNRFMSPRIMKNIHHMLEVKIYFQVMFIIF